MVFCAQVFLGSKGLKVPIFIYRHLQGNLNSSSLQYEVVYWLARAVGSTAQSADAHCPNEWTISSSSSTDPPMSQPATRHTMTRSRLKVWTFIYRRLQGNQNSSCLQFKVVYWPALAVRSASPLPERLWTSSSSLTDHLCPSQPHCGLHPTMFSGNGSVASITSITCYSFTYPRGKECWIGLSTTSVNNLLKVITWQRSWWKSNPGPLSLTSFSSKYYQVLILKLTFTYPERMEGWVGLSTSKNNLFKVKGHFLTLVHCRTQTCNLRLYGKILDYILPLHHRAY